jgi:hypothetical protein
VVLLFVTSHATLTLGEIDRLLSESARDLAQLAVATFRGDSVALERWWAYR